MRSESRQRESRQRGDRYENGTNESSQESGLDCEGGFYRWISSRLGKSVPKRFTALARQGRPSWGVTDAQGRYTMEYTDKKGVEIAQHKVYVTFSPQDIQVKMDLEFGKYKVPPEIKEILKKYGDPETTPLTYDVQESQTIDLALD